MTAYQGSRPRVITWDERVTEGSAPPRSACLRWRVRAHLAGGVLGRRLIGSEPFPHSGPVCVGVWGGCGGVGEWGCGDVQVRGCWGFGGGLAPGCHNDYIDQSED